MRILGIDYGSVRVGVALSDELGMLASPLETVDYAQAIARIKEIISEKNVQKIVLGMPRNMNGSYGPQAEKVRLFAQLLAEKIAIDIQFWDERLSTQEVERMLIQANVSRQQRKKVIDKLAAQRILQNYLDAHEQISIE